MHHVCDFSRSYYVWQINLESRPLVTVSQKQPFRINYVRAPLECRCYLDGTEYVLGTECKTEKVNVQRDIWMAPNAGYYPIASGAEYLRIKHWDRCDKGVMLDPPSRGPQPERGIGKADDAFDFHRIDVQTAQAHQLTTSEAIVEAAMGNSPLVAHTEFTIDDGTNVLLEYPVKSINVSNRDGYYQVDTGPVLFPKNGGIDGLQLAFVAHNAPDWAEFLVNEPTALTNGISVHHYSNPVRVDARNRMFAIT
jgi:hypothetical protein